MGTALKDLIPGTAIYNHLFLTYAYPEMKKRAGWTHTVKPSDVLMFEDRHLGNCRHLPDLDLSLEQSLLFFKSTPYGRDIIRSQEYTREAPQADAEDGAVIIFQVSH